MFESLTNEIDGLSINSKSQFTSEFQAQNEMDNNNLLFFKSTDGLTQHQVTCFHRLVYLYILTRF